MHTPAAATVRPVADDLTNFYATCAQVIPALLLVVALETGLAARTHGKGLATYSRIRFLDVVMKAWGQDPEVTPTDLVHITPDGREITVPAERISEIFARFEQLLATGRGLAMLVPQRGSRMARMLAWSGRRSLGYWGLRWLAPGIVAGAIGCEIVAFVVIAFPPNGTLRVATLVLLLVGLAGLCVLVAAALTGAMHRAALTANPEVFAALEEDVRNIAERAFAQSEEGVDREGPDQ